MAAQTFTARVHAGPMKVRTARPSDLPSVNRLYFQLNPGRRRDGRFRSLRPSVRAKVIVAEEEGEAVGFVWAHLVGYASARVGYVEELFVLPEFRRRGVATRLMKEAMRWFETQRPPVVFVSSSAGDRRAWRFYGSLGFRRTRGPWFCWVPKRR